MGTRHSLGTVFLFARLGHLSKTPAQGLNGMRVNKGIARASSLLPYRCLLVHLEADIAAIGLHAVAELAIERGKHPGVVAPVHLQAGVDGDRVLGCRGALDHEGIARRCLEARPDGTVRFELVDPCRPQACSDWSPPMAIVVSSCRPRETGSEVTTRWSKLKPSAPVPSDVCWQASPA